MVSPQTLGEQSDLARSRSPHWTELVDSVALQILGSGADQGIGIGVA